MSDLHQTYYKSTIYLNWIDLTNNDMQSNECNVWRLNQKTSNFYNTFNEWSTKTTQKLQSITQNFEPSGFSEQTAIYLFIKCVEYYYKLKHICVYFKYIYQHDY